MTLLIFFPRDLEAEAGYRERTTHGSIAPTEAGGPGSEKRGPIPHRPPRPDSVASFETPQLTSSWQDGNRGYSGYSASGYSAQFGMAHNEPPNSATPMVRVVPGDVVEEDGTAFQLFHHPDHVNSTAALKNNQVDLEDGLAPEDMPHILPANMPSPQHKRARPTQQWNANAHSQGPYQQRAVYPPHAGRGRFGGPSPSASAPDVRASRLTVHPMVRNYRSPIGAYK